MRFPKKGKRAPKDSLKGLTAILDKVFSEYIRRRDAGGSEYARCVTCGVVKPWKELDCGHYITRNHLSVRWDIRNCHAQCRSCNSFKGGEQSLHGKAIDRLYGKGTSDQLQVISRVYAGIDETWLRYHISLYRKKIKLLC